MDFFCVIANRDKDPGHRTARYIRSYLEKNGKTCIVAHNQERLGEEEAGYTDLREIPENTQCIIVLGGDGTFIQASIDVSHRSVPLLGVNMGTLGFLTEVEKQNLAPALVRLMADDCRIEERMMLLGELKGADIPYIAPKRRLALNDVVVTKRGSCRIIRVFLYVNGELVETYVGDGVIISTPTGSTGYNLSAGGPVMAPEIHAIIITPICPHSLNKRSLVVSADDEVVLELGRGKAYQPDEADVIFDGRIEGALKTGDRVEVRRSEQKTRIVKLRGASFFGILKNKLKASDGKEEELL